MWGPELDTVHHEWPDTELDDHIPIPASDVPTHAAKDPLCLNHCSGTLLMLSSMFPMSLSARLFSGLLATHFIFCLERTKNVYACLKVIMDSVKESFSLLFPCLPVMKPLCAKPPERAHLATKSC